MASITDKLLSIGKRGTLTTLKAPGKEIGVPSLSIVQPLNWPTDSKVAFSIRRVNIGGENDGKEIPGTYTEWTGIVNAIDGSIDNLSLEQGTDQDYPPGAGTEVMIHISVTVWEHLMSALRGIMNNDGTLKTEAIAPRYPTLTGDASSLAFWRSVPAGTYSATTGTLTNQPYATQRSVFVRVDVTGGDLTVTIWRRGDGGATAFVEPDLRAAINSSTTSLVWRPVTPTASFFTISNSNSQTISNTTGAVGDVALGATAYSTPGFSRSGNSIIVQEPGYYLVIGEVRALDSSNFYAYLALNNVKFSTLSYRATGPSVTGFQTATGTTLQKIEANDAIKIRYENRDTATTISTAQLSVVRIA